MGRFSKGKAAAKHRGIEWTLTFEEFCYLLEAVCYYCCNNLGKLTESGYCLDRLDNSKGYTKDNSVACCWECNRIKGSFLSSKEMLEVAKLLVSLRDPTTVSNNF